MARCKWVVLMAVLALAGCDEAPQLARLSPDAVIVAFGDSLTYGTGAKEGESYPDLLAVRTGLEVLGEGVPGETTDQGLERLPEILEEAEPDLVILIHGGNDRLRKHPRDQTERNLGDMVRMIRASGAAVVMLGVPDFGIPGLLSSAELYERVADSLQVPLDDDTLPDILGKNGLKSDHVHPNAKGYAVMVAAVEELLRQSGAL